MVLLGVARRRASLPAEQASQFVAKPYHYRPLILKIEQMLGREEWLSRVGASSLVTKQARRDRRRDDRRHSACPSPRIYATNSQHLSPDRSCNRSPLGWPLRCS